MGKPAFVLVHKHTGLGGAERSLLEILEEVKQSGYKTYLIYSSSGALHSEFESKTIQQFQISFPMPQRWDNFLKFPSFKKKLREGLKKITGSKVFWIGDLQPLWCMTRSPIEETKIIAQWRGEFDFSGTREGKKWIRYGADRADKLVTSPYVAQYLNQCSEFSPQVQTLCPSIKLDKFTETQGEQSELRKNLEWNEQDYIALCVGRIGRGKGQLLLLKYLLNNLNHERFGKLYFAGEIDEAIRQSFLDAIEKLENVEYLGQRNDVANLMGACDVVLFPGQLNENLPRVVLEAAAAEKPIVAFQTGATKLMLEDYPYCIPKDKEDLFIESWLKLKEEAKRNEAVQKLKKLNFRELIQGQWKEELQLILQQV